MSLPSPPILLLQIPLYLPLQLLPNLLVPAERHRICKPDELRTRLHNLQHIRVMTRGLTDPHRNAWKPQQYIEYRISV